MKWTADTTMPRQLHCKIEQQVLTSVMPGQASRLGYFLYVWENGQGLADEVQDDLEAAIDGAFERYGIPKDAWKKIK